MRVVVVGAGIAGLAAARAMLHRWPNVDLHVLESAPRAGGLIHTERSPFGLLEHGPDSLVTAKPHAMETVRELGLDDELVSGSGAMQTTFVVRDGKLIPLPNGLFSFSAEVAASFLRSPLFSWSGKFRMLCEPLVRIREEEADESLASFVTRRFGKEFLERVVEPLIAGIHGLAADELSARAALPQLVMLERRYGSVAKGMALTRKPKALRAPPVVTLRLGMTTLPAAIAHELGGRLRLGVSVQRIRRVKQARFRLDTTEGTMEADGLIIATPAHVTARLCEELDGSVAHALSGVEHTGYTSVHLAFQRGQLTSEFQGSGFVVPTSEARALKACTWVSHKWPQRSPSDVALVRCFERAMVPTADAVEAALSDLSELAGVRTRPCFTHVVAREQALPAYRVGHLERIQVIEQRAKGLGALALCGNYLRGLGVSDCIASGLAATHVVMQGLGGPDSRGAS